MSERETSNQMAQWHQAITDTEHPKKGDVIEGIVVKVDEEVVYLDFGLKSEVRVSLDEFTTPPKLGDKERVVVLDADKMRVSKREAEKENVKKMLEEAFAQKRPIDGLIKKATTGGFSVELGGGITAFLPISKVDTHRVEDSAKYVGMRTQFLIDRLQHPEHGDRLNVVVTRKELLQAENEAKREEFFKSTQIGDNVTGVVKSFTSFGAFIDLGGFDGLLHLNDMSWGHAARPRDYVQKDQTIELKVARLDPENKRINLSLKHFSNDPWLGFEERYGVDDIVEGKVTKLTDFGAFVELEEGIEGLVHISDLSWSKRIKHPKEVLSVGDVVKVAILGYDTEAEKISLGLKHTMENPWIKFVETNPVGTKFIRAIKKVTFSGAVIELEEGVEGFLHIDDISWQKRPRSAQALLKEGQEVEVLILEIDSEHMRIALGMKQLQVDPWESLYEHYKRGEPVEGEVISKTDFGLFVRVPGEIDGLIHKSQLSEDRNANAEELMERIEIGQKLKALIIEFAPENRRLALSIRELSRAQNRQEMNKYIAEGNDTDDSSGATFADFFDKE
ncbi:S1 RNA-binding domain-containing protein [Entomospira culicis]|uniref:Small ribosomal subunit protein bS1 n=1 Tax=Entomospira culicis TaxID=2719989 RepID=A0A968GGU2_9SPIO|nr:S1 RNA-binding domain-containing protein [Entomospira culicis]NIZ18528.1 S1 RNA-binding domain-containing protein [Entomospira culicis]NIZ68744.1 S1 RNA-binding domain-containing protein [Entomospira culicis]WDI37340.1 S1 RNA-binding domain-containing protein [Entomospira culicis]WDI38969.1 S1 RNA-binding domain-containing protein [Entomospira culicis]